MAASTIAPTAIAMPPSDMMLELRPSRRIGMNAMATVTGIVMMGMSALGTCQRKIKITMATMINSSNRVCVRLSIERRIRSERS